ncbi:MAG: TlpA family protein disulfide reductase [Phycisphaerales bacterium]|nr:TlpA family protein disulfide reductase [Phycisphaerales bacterium]
MTVRTAVRVFMLCGGLLGGVAAGQGPGTAPAPAPAAQWNDRALPDDERAALSQLLGFAPPAFRGEIAWSGESPSWESLRGKVVVLQTWTRATEQGRNAPRRTLELLKKHGDDVRVVALHTPEAADGAKAFIDRIKLPIPVGIDPTGAYLDELGAYKRPVNIVVDRQGAVRFVGLSTPGLARAVEQLVAQPFDASAKKPQAVRPRDERDPSPTAAPGGRRTAGDGEFPPTTEPVQFAKDIRGQKGPEIVVEEWLTEKPKTDGKVVMVEFWATWCGPCRESIPHLGKLQKQFGDDLVIIGVSDEPVSKVRPFMEKTRFEYSVAVDTQRRLFSAPGPRGIPHAFIMSPDGVVRWQGNPLGLKEETVRRIIDAGGAGREEPAGPGGKRWVKKGEPGAP